MKGTLDSVHGTLSMIMRIVLINKIRVALLLAIGVTVSGCGAGVDAGEGRAVVSSTTILGDVVSRLVDPATGVDVLMPPGADPHDFRLSAQAAASMRTAALVVVNGLGLEEGMADALAAARDDGVEVVEVGDLVEPRLLSEGGAPDPHVWLDPVRMAEAVPILGRRLEEAGVEGAVGRAEDYRRMLLATVADMRTILAAVPPERRRLVTNHDSFGYFADRFGFEVIGVVIPGGSTLAEPSAAHLDELARLIQLNEVPAIVAESGERVVLAESLADDLGGEVEVVTVHAAGLAPEGEGPATYLDMLRTLAATIAEGLR